MFDTWTIIHKGVVSQKESDLVLPIDIVDSEGIGDSYTLHQSSGGHLSLWKGDHLVDVETKTDIHSLVIGSKLEVSVSIPRTDLTL